MKIKRSGMLFVCPEEATSLSVMAGLVPAIHVLSIGNEDVDARHKAGHDD
jgi:hypothetical protein